MTRISPAIADRFALFVEALGAEAAEVPHEAEGSATVERGIPEGAPGSELERDIRSNCL